MDIDIDRYAVPKAPPNAKCYEKDLIRPRLYRT